MLTSRELLNWGDEYWRKVEEIKSEGCEVAEE